MQRRLTSCILHSSVTLTLAILGTEELNLSLSSLIWPRKDRTGDELLPGLQQLPVVNPATEQPHQKSLPVWFALSIEQQRVDQTSPSSLLYTCFSSATKQKKTALTIWKGTTTNLEGNDCAESNPVPRAASRSNPSSLNVLGLSLCWFQISLGKTSSTTMIHFKTLALQGITLHRWDFYTLKEYFYHDFYFLKQTSIDKIWGKCSTFDDQ